MSAADIEKLKPQRTQRRHSAFVMRGERCDFSCDRCGENIAVSPR